MFLKRNDQSMELRDKLAAVDTACDVEYQGSRVYKDIHNIVSSPISSVNGKKHAFIKSVGSFFCNRSGP